MKWILFAVIVLVVSAQAHLQLDRAITLLPQDSPRGPLIVLSMFVVAWLGAWLVSRKSGLQWKWPIAIFWVLSLLVQLLVGLDASMRMGRYP